MKLWIKRHKTPIGPALTWRSQRGLVMVGFEEQKSRLERQLRRRFGAFTVAPDHDSNLTSRMRAYFAGDVKALDPLPTDTAGTPLQIRIWRSLRKVPAGRTIAYGELARRLSTSPRVVGNAMGSNPVCLVVPCHRVIGSDGSLTGYAYGTDRKRWLLEHEKGTGPSNRPF